MAKMSPQAQYYILWKIVTDLEHRVSAVEKRVAELNKAGAYPGLTADWTVFDADFQSTIVTAWNNQTDPFAQPYTDGGFKAAKIILYTYSATLAEFEQRVEVVFTKPWQAPGPGSTGALLPNGTRIGGGGGGIPKVPGPDHAFPGPNFGGSQSGGRGRGGSAYFPGIGFFPGGGAGSDDLPSGPWNGGGSRVKRPTGGTGRQPDPGGGNKGTTGGGSTGTGDGGRGGGLGEGAADTRQVLGSDLTVECGTGTYDFGTVICTPPEDTGRPSDDGGGGGADEGPPIRKGGPYSPNAAPKHRAPFRAPTAPLTYLDFLHKGVGSSDDGWGGNNPRAAPGVGKGDLFRPADDAVGPYNPKGTDYRPAPDDPNPGGPAGASVRAPRIRVG